MACAWRIQGVGFSHTICIYSEPAEAVPQRRGHRYQPVPPALGSKARELSDSLVGVGCRRCYYIYLLSICRSGKVYAIRWPPSLQARAFILFFCLRRASDRGEIQLGDAACIRRIAVLGTDSEISFLF